MNPQIADYLKQSIRVLTLASLEAELGTTPDANLAATLRVKADECRALLPKT